MGADTHELSWKRCPFSPTIVVWKPSAHMSRCNFWGPHHVPVGVHHVDPLGELAVPHQGHVTDVSSRWRFRKPQFVQSKYEGRRTLDKQQDDARLADPPTAGKGTNLCMMVRLAGLNLLAFLIRTFSPTYPTRTDKHGNITLKSRVRAKSCATHGYRNSTGNGSSVTLKKLQCRCRLKGG